jgi:hypothetical protein
MNKRIQELSNIAYKNHLANNPHSSFSVRQDYMKEFAELIVGECYLWAKENGGLGCEEDFEALKEHFGVTE